MSGPSLGWISLCRSRLVSACFGFGLVPGPFGVRSLSSPVFVRTFVFGLAYELIPVLSVWLVLSRFSVAVNCLDQGVS